jgi:hypothetical protein
MCVTLDEVWIGYWIYRPISTSNYSAAANSRIYKSQTHPLSLFQPAVSSSAVPWQWFLTVKILLHHALRFYLHSLPCRALLNSSQCHIATDGRSVSQSWRQAQSGAHLLLFDSYSLVIVGRPLWREDGSVFCQSHCLERVIQLYWTDFVSCL